MKTNYLKLLLCLFASFIPGLAFAESATAMNFDPPASDLSVTFLTNIFGTVDGVLYGGGSQILGSMFAVFNSAVLSIGGMILIYTVVVATINTAGEGKLLGKTWSSIWVPIRTTIGISLLFTYPSGYSVIQVLFMWIVVQGIGAADLMWNEALNYLQRGGVIVAPMESAKTSNTAGGNSIISGAGVILTGTTCMVALEQQLNTLQTSYLNDPSGPCSDLPTDGSGTQAQKDMADFCNNPVPDFLSSVDIMALNTEALDTCTAENNAAMNSEACKDNPTLCEAVCVNSDASAVSAPMPNFPDDFVPASYIKLNGICGTIKWNLMNQSAIDDSASTIGLTEDESTEMTYARATAVTQIYSSMTSLANQIVRNDLTLYGTGETNCSASSGGSCYLNYTDYYALSPLGIPVTSSETSPCSSGSTCTNWISPISGFAPVLNGTEYQGAVRDYNSFMEPTLNALYNEDDIAKNSDFIDDAQEQGWIMAGSYFYDLSKLNESSQGSYTDTSSGLDAGTYPSFAEDFCTNDASSAFSEEVNLASDVLCTWYTGGNSKNTSDRSKYNNQIKSLIRGPVVEGGKEATAPSYQTTWPGFYIDELNTTVYGYASNASNVTLADQQGTNAPGNFMTTFPMPDMEISLIDHKSCSKGMFNLGNFCTVMVNGFIDLLNMLITIIITMLMMTISILLFVPLAAFSTLFTTAAGLMDNSVNSIISLAMMGDLFINTCIMLILSMVMISAVIASTVVALPGYIAVLCMAGPFIMSWIGMILAMGVSLAYFIPMIPYMLYTFAAIGWMIGVVETMVAAPLVALGVSLPEGDHDVFGKGVASLMLLLNAFLRPSLIVVGYVAAIIISTVGVWFINTGFTHFQTTYMSTVTQTYITVLFVNFFLFFFYVTMCIGVVNTAFELIYKLPEQILRWIGGSHAAGGLGSDAAHKIAGEVKGSTEQGGKAMESGASNADDTTGTGGKKKESQDGEASKGGGDSKGGTSIQSGGESVPPAPPVC